MSEEYKIPQHVAIILDGNGRWAKQRHMPRNYGHKVGADNLEQVIEDAWDLGIKYLTGIQFNVALNYGGRDEITRAVKKIADEISEGVITKEDITEEYISSKLDTADIPDPDLLIRTSGELRISNFLPWQISYSEFYFCDTLWPDFDKEALKKAIDYYNGRDRRFGGV